MFTSNPFAELSAFIAPAVMQTYVVLMIVLVAAGTLFDIVHKGSAKYFFANWRKSRSKGTPQVELASIALQTAVVDVLASGEFCNARRRVAHLLTMYGFVLYVVTTAVMVFRYATPATPGPDVWPVLWWIGGLMILAGGYWFWFFIRADVAAEGNHPLAARERDARPDLGLRPDARQLVDARVVRAVRDSDDGAVRLGGVVQVRPHVLQARRGVRKKGFVRERHAEQPARRR